MAGIIQRVKAPVIGILETLVFADPELRENVTYRHYQSSDVDPVTKRTVTKFKDYNVTAVRMRHTKETVAVSSTVVEIGQPFFLFKAEDIPKGRLLSKKDVIVDSFGDTLAVVETLPVFSIITGVTVAA